MAIRSGIFGALTTVVLMLLFGNRWAFDNAPSGGPAPDTLRTIIGFFSWDPERVPDASTGAKYLSLVVLVVATFVLGAAVGRARPLSAFVGGWGAGVGAAALSGMAFAATAGERAYPVGGELVDRAFFAAGDTTVSMVALGWLVGLAVMLGSFGAKQPKVAPAAGTPLPPAGSFPPPDGGHPPPNASPPSWEPSAPAPSASAPPPAPAPAPAPAPPSPPPAPGGPAIGPPPDRTQVLPPQQ